MTLAVRVLSAHVRAWHVEDEEVTLGLEGQLARILARRQRAPQIDGELHLMQRHAARPTLPRTTRSLVGAGVRQRRPACAVAST